MVNEQCVLLTTSRFTCLFSSAKVELLYLTSWQEDDLPEDMRRSWKGYPFDILNELTDQDLIQGSYKAKSVYLTKAGIEEARRLLDENDINDDDR